MIESRVERTVDYTPRELWEELVSPDKIEKLLPEINVVKQRGNKYEISATFLDDNAVLKKTERKPNMLKLESKDPKFGLKTNLEECNSGTKVIMKVKADAPSIFGMVDALVEDKLNRRMDENLNKLEKEMRK